MTKRDEPYLRVVEAMEAISIKPPARPAPALPRRRVAPSRAEALAALRAMKGAESVIERIPALGNIEVWGEVAYWNCVETRGAAVDGVYLWDCDFPGVMYSLSDAYGNRTAYFSGAERLGAIIPPSADLTGQVWCDLDVPASGIYLFVAQVQTYLDLGDDNLPDYVAIIECCIDSTSLGTRTLYLDTAINQVFVLNLSAGYHRFSIRQIQGGLFFGLVRKNRGWTPVRATCQVNDRGRVRGSDRCENRKIFS